MSISRLFANLDIRTDVHVYEWTFVGYFLCSKPGHEAQSVGHLTRNSGVLGSIPSLATYLRFSFRFFKKGSCQFWRKYVHEVLVNRLGGLSLPRKSVVRLTDRLDMTLDVYCGRKTTIQPTNQPLFKVPNNHPKSTQQSVTE